MTGSGECLEVWDRARYRAEPRGASPTGSPTSQRALATLLDMTKTHVPVLAGELIELLDPRPGETAVDCTVGGGGHARLIADRIGPAGTLIGIDRDPLAEERFAELAAEVPCQTRFIRADFVSALARAARGAAAAPTCVYLDLGMSSMQVDTWERGFSYAYDAPLDMRMDPEQELTAEEIVNTWDERRLARLLREYGEERYASQIARAIARARRREELASTQQLVDAIKSAVPVPAQFAGGHPGAPDLPGAADRRQRRARAARAGAAGGLGAARLPAGGWRRSRSTRSRTGSSSGSSPTARAAASARPSCRSASAAASPRPSCLTRRAVAPTPGEVAANPAIKVSAPARRPQAGGHADMTPTALTPAGRGTENASRQARLDRPPRRRARADRRPRQPAAPAARLGPASGGATRQQRPTAPARTPAPAPAARAARARPATRASPLSHARWLRSSSRYPTTRCSTGSSAAAPGSRCSACCWPGSSRCRSRC